MTRERSEELAGEIRKEFLASLTLEELIEIIIEKVRPEIETQAKRKVLEDFFPVLEALGKEGGLIEGLGAIKVLVKKIQGYKKLLKSELPKDQNAK